MSIRRASRGRLTRRPFPSRRGLANSRGVTRDESRPSSPFIATSLFTQPGNSRQSAPTPPQPVPVVTCSSAALTTMSISVTSNNGSPVTHQSSSGSGERPGEIRDSIRNVQTRIRNLEEKTGKLTAAIKELSDLMKKYCKNSFIVKGSEFEAPIKSEVAGLFCSSLRREPPTADIQAALVRVIGNPRQDKYRFDVAYSYARSKLTELRTEELRRRLPSCWNCSG